MDEAYKQKLSAPVRSTLLYDFAFHWCHPAAVWPEKNCQMSIKVAQKWFHKKIDWFSHLYKIYLRMREIGAN